MTDCETGSKTKYIKGTRSKTGKYRGTSTKIYILRDSGSKRGVTEKAGKNESNLFLHKIQKRIQKHLGTNGKCTVQFKSKILK